MSALNRIQSLKLILNHRTFATVLLSLSFFTTPASANTCLAALSENVTSLKHQSSDIVYIEFVENSEGSTPSSTSTKYKPNSKVEIRLDLKTKNILIKVYSDSELNLIGKITGVRIHKPGFEDRIGTEDIFRFLEEGYSYIHTYRNTKGDLTQIQFVGYQPGFGYPYEMLLSF